LDSNPFSAEHANTGNGLHHVARNQRFGSRKSYGRFAGLGEGVGVGLGDGLGVASGVGVAVGDPLGLGLGIGIGLCVGTGVSVGVGGGAGEVLGDGTVVGLALGVDLEVPFRVFLPLGVAGAITSAGDGPASAGLATSAPTAAGAAGSDFGVLLLLVARPGVNEQG